MRQPAVTGVALVTCIAGAALAMLSANTNFVVSSMPMRPEVTPRSLMPCATRSNGLSSSCHVRTSEEANGPVASSSRARSSSNAGQTVNGSPFAGSTIANSRSLPPQRMPLK